MRTFQDRDNRVWTVAVDVNAIKRVRALCDVDLLEIVGGDLLERLTSDPVLLCDVIYAVCKPEADGRGVTDEDFGRSLVGDAIDRATDVLLEDLIGFFPSQKRRVLELAMKKIAALEDVVVQAALARLESGEVEARLRELLTSGESSTSTPESPESIPAP